ncbi:fatty acid desaturase-domain-containing protein [Vararia minispora EC-137]|uniref:Fatty acid desaturase-domain-containing protein n=1 Tax=Vararia minispora EC-137 TaxID=1314806 RepID=A0ACB8QEP1_9AGAM|nr:fatty acid desaturase-domain-containing protein [Vararia minispora EC-137]
MDPQKDFSPPDFCMNDIRAAVPPHLFARSTRRSLLYLVRDLAMVVSFGYFATWIDSEALSCHLSAIGVSGDEILALRCALWLAYWWFQGLAFTGVWVIGHECGHGAFSSSSLVCNTVGFITHTVLWTPYFSWRISHRRHHQNHASMEKDEVYVPKTRSDLGLPPLAEEGSIKYEEILGDTPVYTLFMLVRQQLLAFPAYLLFNVSGQKHYPRWSNSVLFTKGQHNAVMASNAGMLAMLFAVRFVSTIWGITNVIKYYGIPWLCVTHWFIMITYLHHTSPEIPHYRASAWTFQRGAAATVDRNFLGWQGRFFLHDVAHFHVVHHFFPKAPYNGEEATTYLQKAIGSHYLYSDKPSFRALWRSYNDCQFVEDDGDILFYRDRRGNFIRQAVAPTES